MEPDKAAKNHATLARLAEIFKKYSTYKIQIEGHANLVNFDNPAKAKIEQEQELLPLSKKRADAIREALDHARHRGGAHHDGGYRSRGSRSAVLRPGQPVEEQAGGVPPCQAVGRRRETVQPNDRLARNGSCSSPGFRWA